MRAWVAIVAALVATPAVAADQFDLVCKGLERGRPTEQRYRIDLQNKRWCRGECKLGTDPIQEVTLEKLVLQHKERRFLGDLTIIHEINRTSGAWTDYWSGGMADAKGVCEPSPFSGMPASTTKF